MKKIASVLLASAFVPAVAYAQTTPAPSGTDAPAGAMSTETPAADAPAAGATSTPATDTPAAGGMSTAATAGEGPFVTVPPTGAWRASDLEGKSVYDANEENIGNIRDTLVNEEGEVIAVLVGVGGFLGIGAKDVAVSMDALEFGPTSMDGVMPAPAADAATPAAGGMAATGTATGATGAAPADPAAPAGGTAAMEPPVVGEDNLPDRIVLNVTREQLEAAPAYGEAEDAAVDSGAAGTTGGMAPAGGAMAPAGGAAGTAPAN